MESQAVEPSVEPSPDLSGFDWKLSTILNDFFKEKRIPIDNQQLLVHELRRAYIFSAAEFNSYLVDDLAGAKDRFGVFVFHFDKHAEGNAGLDRSAREELMRYFKYVQTERSTSTAKDAMIALQRDPLSGMPLDVTEFRSNQKAKETLAEIVKFVARLHDILYHPELQYCECELS